jgi:Relaxase/Mobilisation nuclease domain
MPYVKSIPIRATVNKSIAYILNPQKTDSLLHVSGLNCVAEKAIAYQQFQGVYQRYDTKRDFSNNAKKKPIKAHHFIQSFKEGDITPEISHKIAEDWAKQVFGDNRQVVIATHIDKGHVHNHFIVNAYDFDGKKFYSNKSSLQRAREISDKVSLEHGITPIQGNKKKGVHYKEWLETKKGSSWKQNIRLTIDKAVIKAKDIDDLFTILQSHGYEIKKGKHISIRPKNLERFVRIQSLGEQYKLDNLIMRIKNKEFELPILLEPTQPIRKPTAKFTANKKPSYKGIQLKYVSLIKLIADLIVKDQKPARKYNPKKPYSKENDYDINKIASHLRLLNRENIESESELIKKHQEVQLAFTETKGSLDKLGTLDESLKGIINHGTLYLDLRDKTDISSSDKLKFTIAQSIVKKYNITRSEDLLKLEKEREKVKQNKESLQVKYDAEEKRFKELNDLVQTYKKIANNTYLQQIQKDRHSRDDKTR